MLYLGLLGWGESAGLGLRNDWVYDWVCDTRVTSRVTGRQDFDQVTNKASRHDHLQHSDGL